MKKYIAPEMETLIFAAEEAIAGILASNHDVTDLFIDSALKICRDNVDEFALAVKEIADFVNANEINCVITSSIAPAALPAELHQFLQQ